MSEVKVNKISPRTNCGTVTLGDSGDTFTIPSGATITNAGTASGFGATGEISWDTTVKTTGTFTATAGVGYFLNTTGGTITVNLPAGAAGSSVALADYAGTWQTSNVTVSPNGSEKIGGVAADVTLNTEGQSVTFVYIDGTQGWVNVLDSTSNVRGATYMSASGGNSCGTDGNYKYHVFTGPGTFTVSSISGIPSNNVVDYLVVAGGAGGGGGTPNWTQAGGGGAGGYRTFVSNPTTSPKNAPAGITVSATAYPIAVGGGGAGGAGGGCGAAGTSGSVSTFSSISSAGGGGGGSYAGPVAAVAGGSGGGGANASAGPNICGAAGNTPPVSPSQGSNGGNANRAFVGPTNYQNFAGGGGGANAVGGNGGPTCDPGTGGVGGAGEPNYITGSNVTYAGGGGGGGAGVNASGNPIPGGGGAGGAGGGGVGMTAGRTGDGIPWGPGNTGGAGTANTGGGGGGGAANGDNDSPEFGTAGGAGGSGIVIIRYRYQ